MGLKIVQFLIMFSKEIFKVAQTKFSDLQPPVKLRFPFNICDVNVILKINNYS